MGGGGCYYIRLGGDGAPHAVDEEVQVEVGDLDGGVLQLAGACEFKDSLGLTKKVMLLLLELAVVFVFLLKLVPSRAYRPPSPRVL